MNYTLRDSKGNLILSVESSPAKSQEGVGAVIGTILVLPYVLAAIGLVIFGIATRISDAKSNSVFKSFAKENKDLITKITKILTDKLNELIKIKEPLKADATRIANSIKEFWFLQPVVIDKDNIIIIWHWRVEWAKKLGLKKVPCVIMEELTDAQVKKLRILDNRLNESEWDLENLRQELNILWDFNIWDLKISKAELFPEMETEEFNADDYETLTATLIIKVKDDMELEMLKKDLDNLWYTNYK